MPHSLTDTIAREIRAELARQRLTNRELAERVGIQPSGISRRLDGEIPLKVSEVEQIAAALGVSVTQFVGADVASAA